MFKPATDSKGSAAFRTSQPTEPLDGGGIVEAMVQAFGFPENTRGSDFGIERERENLEYALREL